MALLKGLVKTLEYITLFSLHTPSIYQQSWKNAPQKIVTTTLSWMMTTNIRDKLSRQVIIQNITTDEKKVFLSGPRQNLKNDALLKFFINSPTCKWQIDF